MIEDLVPVVNVDRRNAPPPAQAIVSAPETPPEAFQTTVEQRAEPLSVEQAGPALQTYNHQDL